MNEDQLHYCTKKCFRKFCDAATLKETVFEFRKLCVSLGIDQVTDSSRIFSECKKRLRQSHKASHLFEILSARRSLVEYENSNACKGLKCLVVGAGPCGLRCAIELAFLGADVIVVEKRESFSRRNVLRLWPYVENDLKALGAKFFYPKFGLSDIIYISIQRLQTILLKIALISGVRIFTNESFVRIREPVQRVPSLVTGWTAEFQSYNDILSSYEFDVLIGADGRRSCLSASPVTLIDFIMSLSYSTLQLHLGHPRSLYFKVNESSSRLAIAITANFQMTPGCELVDVHEISGMISYSNLPFFRDLAQKLDIDLENLVYYREDTNYFIFTAKKDSLLKRGVIKRNLANPDELLAPENVDRAALEAYALDVAHHSTEGKLGQLRFERNAKGEPDVSMFDFTRMFKAEHAVRVIERLDQPLLQCLVGDGLIEPFWPVGSGCGLGFLSSMDAAWTTKQFALGESPASFIARGELMFQKLTLVTAPGPKCELVTLDPETRYQGLNVKLADFRPYVHLYDSDLRKTTPKRRGSAWLRGRRKLRPSISRVTLFEWIVARLVWYAERSLIELPRSFSDTDWRDGRLLYCLLHLHRPQLFAVSWDAALRNGLWDGEELLSRVARHLSCIDATEPDQDWFECLVEVYRELSVDRPRLDLFCEPPAPSKPKRGSSLSMNGSLYEELTRSLRKVPPHGCDSMLTRIQSFSVTDEPDDPLLVVENGLVGKRSRQLLEQLNASSNSAPRRLERPATRPQLSVVQKQALMRPEPRPNTFSSQQTFTLERRDRAPVLAPARTAHSPHRNGNLKPTGMRASNGDLNVTNMKISSCSTKRPAMKRIFLCATCQHAISDSRDRTCFSGLYFHRRCLRCAECLMPLQPNTARKSPANEGNGVVILCECHYKLRSIYEN